MKKKPEPEPEVDDDEEVIIRVQASIESNEIWVLIPPSLWDAENLAEGIKKAILMTVAQMPDNLDS